MVTLSVQHPIFDLEAVVFSRVQEFLSLFGFNLFHYMRCNLDGTVSTLSTYNLIFRQFSTQFKDSPFLFVLFPEELRKLHSYGISWEEMPDHAPIDIANSLGFFEIMSFIYRYTDYYEVFILGLPQAVKHALLLYLSRQVVVERFFLHFKKKNQDILTIAAKHSIQLLPSNLESFHSELCLRGSKISVLRRGEGAYLTHQELECVRMMQVGLTNKEIASLMQISLRSVETYQARIKSRLNLSYKEEFLDLTTEVYRPF